MMELCGEGIKGCDDVVRAIRNAPDGDCVVEEVSKVIEVYGIRITGLIARALACAAREEWICDLCGMKGEK